MLRSLVLQCYRAPEVGWSLVLEIKLSLVCAIHGSAGARRLGAAARAPAEVQGVVVVGCWDAALDGL